MADAPIRIDSPDTWLPGQKTLTIRVTLNGTGVNPFYKMGLRMNPFPQIARGEVDAAMWQLNSLDAEPITGPDDIRSRLAGWSEEFIQLCIEQFKPGERHSFTVTFPDYKS
jgi:hypothetical protein